MKNINRVDHDKKKCQQLSQSLEHILNVKSQNCCELINKFDEYTYGNKKNITPYMVDVTIKYYDFILDLFKNKNYNILPKFTLKKILRIRNYIKKTNIIIYENKKKKMILFPNYIKATPL